MKVTFLGTGTSQGIPVIGCQCAVCQSTDVLDKRLRTSIMININGKNLVIDAGPDFRQQMLNASVDSVEAILLTHEHNDHIIGLDDVRPFNFSSRKDMPIYGLKRVLNEVKKRFAYVFVENPYPGAPCLKLNVIDEHSSIDFFGQEIIPFEIMHGLLPILGYRIGGLTYMTDTKTLNDKELKKIKGTKVLILNALHHRPHHSHLNMEEALEMVERIAPEKAYFIHMSHYMGLHASISKQLPPHIHLSHDGLEITL